MTGAVQSFIAALWQLRENGGLRGRAVHGQSRLLYVAAWRDMEDRPGYDPEQDQRIDWARQILAAARAGCARPLAHSADEAAVEMMLRTGDFAAPTTTDP